MYSGVPFYNHSIQEDFVIFEASLVYIVLVSHSFIVRPCFNKTKGGEMVHWVDVSATWAWGHEYTFFTNRSVTQHWGGNRWAPGLLRSSSHQLLILWFSERSCVKNQVKRDTHPSLGSVCIITCTHTDMYTQIQTHLSLGSVCLITLYPHRCICTNTDTKARGFEWYYFAKL